MLRRYLDDDVSLLLLGVNVGIKVGLAGLDRLLDRLNRVAAFLVVSLHLPVELGLGGDVDVDTEVHLQQKHKTSAFCVSICTSYWYGSKLIA